MIDNSSAVRLPVCSEAGGHAISVSVSGNSRSRRSILCLPGILETQNSFYHFTDKVSDVARSFTVDFAGRGASDNLSIPSQYRMSGCLRDANVAYSYVQGAMSSVPKPVLRQAFLGFDDNASEATHIHLVGNSMGGLLAVLLASLKPTSLRSLVINDIGSTVSWASLIFLFGALGRSSYLPDMAAGLMNSSRQLAQSLNVDEKLISAVLQPSYLDLPHKKSMAGLNFEETFQSVDIPVLLIRSAESKIFTPSVRDSMLDVYQNCSFYEVDGSQHPVAYTAEVTQVILDFMVDAEREFVVKTKIKRQIAC